MEPKFFGATSVGVMPILPLSLRLPPSSLPAFQPLALVRPNSPVACVRPVPPISSLLCDSIDDGKIRAHIAENRPLGRVRRSFVVEGRIAERAKYIHIIYWAGERRSRSRGYLPPVYLRPRRGVGGRGWGAGGYRGGIIGGRRWPPESRWGFRRQTAKNATTI